MKLKSAWIRLYSMLKLHHISSSGMAIILGKKYAKIRTLDFSLHFTHKVSFLVNPRNFRKVVLKKQKNAKFEFWRIFEILTRYRVWSLLPACKKPMYLADFWESNHLSLGKKNFFLIYLFFSTELNAKRWNSLKFDTTLIFTGFLSSS